MSGVISEESDWIASTSNAASLLGLLMDDINWAGFYFHRKKELILGPFQGRPACTRIPIGQGVCGTAAETLETQVVPDVNKFPGHIACDIESQSEIVIPIVNDEKLIGVLDIDSPTKNRFDQQDKKYLEEFVEILNKYIKWEVI
ncbi:GAF domain-containing protein [Clostridiisalibacter paucivorans]|uniref:GAF domain-containing protein n=1 Tax=Clostridiisalibacter paucivorans TaxID=408753 RepID=UPI001FE20ECB|nr:GAF domain-containing protein [Clostridiisalibacter paucivorans]